MLFLIFNTALWVGDILTAVVMGIIININCDYRSPPHPGTVLLDALHSLSN